MSHQTTEFRTVEDMVARVLALPEDKTMYELEVNVNSEWDDVAAGVAWEDKLSETDWGSEEREEFFKSNPRPDSHKITTRYLMEVGQSWHWSLINLSDELGAAVEAAWPKQRLHKWSSIVGPAGHRTLAGVLKLLGKSDIGKQVADAKAKTEQTRAEQRRANVLAQIERLARDLAECVAKDGGDVGVDYVTVGRGEITLYDSITSIVKEVLLTQREAEA